MYFEGDSELLNYLDDDWSQLLKNIKNREQWHLTLLKRNRHIIHRDRAEDDQSQIDQQIVQIKQEMTKLNEQSVKTENEQRQIIQKYDILITDSQQVMKLMSRVGSKYLQINQNSLEKTRLLDTTIWEKHNLMKRNLITLLNSRQNMNVQHLMSTILNYGRKKVEVELSKMQKLMQALESKDYGKLKDIYYVKQKVRTGSVERIREIMIERKREHSLSKDERGSAKKNDGVRKPKSKLFILYGIMILSKHQFTDEYGGSNQEKKQRFFNDLMHKNRKNNEHIITFRQLENQYYDKICNFQPPEPSIPELSPVPQILQFNNKSCTEALSKKKKEKQLTESITFNQYLATQGQNYPRGDVLDDDQLSLVKRMSITKNKFGMKLTEDCPTICNKTLTQTNQSMIRFDISKREVKNDRRRGKLPDINRGTSLDIHKTPMPKIPKLASTRGNFKQEINNIEEDILQNNGMKQKWMRDDKLTSQRAKVIMKNIEVGIPFSSKRGNWSIKKDESIIIKQRKKTDTVMETTANCKRTLTKFFDGKLNGVL